MRAWHNWLAVGPLLVILGCATSPERAVPGDCSSGLSPEDDHKAGALAHYGLALISEATLGGSDAALLHLRAASASDPSNLPLALKVASDHLARKDYQLARTVLTRTVAHHPRSAEVRLLLGMAHQLNSESKLAEREYRAAVKLDPAATEPRIRLAALYVAEERIGKALGVVDPAMEQPRFRQAMLDFCITMGRLLLLSGQPEQAVVFWERAVRADPDRLEIRSLLARAQAAAGNRRAAISGLLELAGRVPGDNQVALLLGELHEDEGDLEAAARQYERVVKASPDDPVAVMRLAGAILKERPGEALKLVEESARKHPDNMETLTYLGLLYSRAERFDDAVGCFAKVEAQALKGAAGAKSLQPHFYFWYGSACERAGRLEEGERLLTTCLELAPDSAQALNYLAYMWAEKGVNLDKALEYATRAVKLVPDEGAYLDTMGWVYYKRGEHSKALDYLRKAIKAMPDDPVIVDHLGDVFHALGRERQARRYWQKALTLGPGKLAPSRREEE